eukprot:scaffold38855_cov191-Amphora_coffeaeformis.AAC.1
MLREAAADYGRFFVSFFGTPGAPQILLVSIFFSLGLGSIYGIVPQVAGDRYARLHHGYKGPACSSLLRQDDDQLLQEILDPAAVLCQLGSDDARNAAAWANVGLSLFSLFLTPVVASISDVRGRKRMILASIMCNGLPPLLFLCMVKIPTFHPLWYYATSTLYGAVDFLTMAFAALADVIPPDDDRAPAYGLLLAAFYGGYALAPSIPLLFASSSQKNEQVAMFSVITMFTGFLVTALLLPETLSPENQKQATIEQAAVRQAEQDSPTTTGWARWIFQTATSPLREISILGSSLSLGLIAAGAFFEEMVFASDDTLVIYYLESQLNVKDSDIASMYFVMGIMGIILQGFVLQPLVRAVGEKGLLVLSFATGVLYNVLYRISKSKKVVYVSLILSQVTGLNSSIVSSVASKTVPANQQGRVQGALCALDSIGYAAGSITVQFVYEKTKDIAWLGPGF